MSDPDYTATAPAAETPTTTITLEHLIGSWDVPAGSWEDLVEACIKPVMCHHVPLLLACYAATNWICRLTTSWKGLKLQKLAGQVSMYPAFPVMIVTSHLTLADRRFHTSDYHHRFAHSSWECDLFANFYIAANIVQAMGQLQTEKSPLLYQLMAHHALSIACYSAGFYFNRFRWWTALAGACEITNLFLVPVFACKEYFPEWKTQTWYLWNSRLLWMSFVTHRLILFPAWLGLWVRDRYVAATDERFEYLHIMEGVLYPVTIAGLLLLSCVWFGQIHRGLKKQTVAYWEARKTTKLEKEKLS